MSAPLHADSRRAKRKPRKAYLLRLPPELLDAWRRVAASELRSLNAQLELELRRALERRGVRLGGEDATEA